jgi:transcriptional regulator with XRE-family HTH domain
MKKINKKDFVASKDPILMTSGKMLATLRRLQGFTQAELAKRVRMTQANISNMELGRQQIGRDRALILAKALKVHPAVIMFPNYQAKEAITHNVQESITYESPEPAILSTRSEGIDYGLLDWQIHISREMAFLVPNAITNSVQKREAQRIVDWRGR